MKTNTSPIAQALALNLTKKSKFAINLEQVGDSYAKWELAISKAYKSFYEYELAGFKAMKTNADTDADATTAAYDALKNILDLVGEYDGYAIPVNSVVLNALSKNAVKVVRERIGDALYARSVYDNLKKQYDAIGPGMSAEYIADLEQRLAEAKEDTKLADAEFGSASTYYTRTTRPAFKKSMETTIALILTRGDMKLWADLEAEEERKAQARRERAKERRAAKKAAEEAAKANA